MLPQSSLALFPYGVLIAGCIFATVTDIRFRRIPNAVPIVLLAIAVILRSFHGPLEALTAIATALVVAIVGSLLFSRGWLGGGDIKLMAAACAFFSPIEDLHFLLFVTIGGGVLAIVSAALKGSLRETFASVFTILHLTNIDHTIAVVPRTCTTLPYAIAITFGALALTAMHTFPSVIRTF